MSGRSTAGRVLRCLSVSVFTTALSLVTLALLVAAGGMAPWLANVIATAVGTVPSYTLNRRWVWSVHRASDPWREVAPFWAMSFAGLVLSTLAVTAADAWTGAIGVFGSTHTAALLLANAGAFGSLWVAQFLVLDRVLFGRGRTESRDESWTHRRAGRRTARGSLLACRPVVLSRRPPSAPPNLWTTRCIHCVERK